MDSSTFEYLKPTDEQMDKMTYVRDCFGMCARNIDAHIPEGADKTYLMRKLRECAMWANVAITRNSDGSPRT